MEKMIFSGAIMLIVAVLAGIATKKLTGSKPITQVVFTLTAAVMFMALVVPAFVGEVSAITNRRLAEIKDRNSQTQREIQAEAQREKELMSGVHEEIRRQNEEARVRGELKRAQLEAESARQVDTDALFDKWYKPLEGCKVVAEVNMMMCANHRIKERARFEQLHAAGKIH